MGREDNLIPFEKGHKKKGGVKKGYKSWKTRLKENLSIEDYEEIIKGLKKKCKDGDIKAIQLLQDRMDGKPTETVNQNIKADIVIDRDYDKD